jgi:cytochrome P450
VTPSLPVQQLATCPDPTDEYAEMRERGVHCRDGAWLVARPNDVAAALASPALSVAPARSQGGTAAQLLARMARFSDGAEHAQRRARVEALLPEAGLEFAAARAAGDLLERSAGVVDAMPIARTVPVSVLAAALGVPEFDVEQVVTMTGRLCEGVSPSHVAGSTSPDGENIDDAAERLLALLAPVGSGDDDEVVAVASVLFQARDATAALVGAALLISAEPGADDEFVERALRQHPPVQCTRRTALADVELGGVTVPRGASVWVFLAAAETGPPAAATTFGSGPHACPGSGPAVALANGVVDGIRSAGWRPVPGQPVRYEPRPNLRLPARILVARR